MSKVKLDLSKMKHVRSDDKTTTLRHPNGHEITLAHSALSPVNRAQLQALSKSAQMAETPLQSEERRDQMKMADGGILDKVQEGIERGTSALLGNGFTTHKERLESPEGQARLFRGEPEPVPPVVDWVNKHLPDMTPAIKTITDMRSSAHAPGFADGGKVDYQGAHRSPDESHGAPLHELTKVFPKDIYSHNASKLYPHGADKKQDADTIKLMHSVKGRPDAKVTIYRAVPHHVNEINPGDWVSINKDYAELHGFNRFDNKYKLLSKEVPAKEVYTSDSIHEQGYHPEKKADGGVININRRKHDRSKDESKSHKEARDLYKAEGKQQQAMFHAKMAEYHQHLMHGRHAEAAQAKAEAEYHEGMPDQYAQGGKVKMYADPEEEVSQDDSAPTMEQSPVTVQQSPETQESPEADSGQPKAAKPAASQMPTININLNGQQQQQPQQQEQQQAPEVKASRAPASTAPQQAPQKGVPEALQPSTPQNTLPPPSVAQLTQPAALDQGATKRGPPPVAPPSAGGQQQQAATTGGQQQAATTGGQQAAAAQQAAPAMPAMAPSPEQQKAVQVQDQILAPIKDIQDAVMNDKITPKTYADLFGDKSTPQKLSTAFGLLLSGLGSGLSGQPNAVLSMMDKVLENDMKAQEKNIANKHSFLSLIKDYYKTHADVRYTGAMARQLEFQLAKNAQISAAIGMEYKRLNALPDSDPKKVPGLMALHQINTLVGKDAMNVAASVAGIGAQMEMLSNATQPPGAGVPSDSDISPQEQAFKNKVNGLRKTSVLLNNPALAAEAQKMEERHVEGLSGEANKPVEDFDRKKMTAARDFYIKAEDLIKYVEKNKGIWPTIAPTEAGNLATAKASLLKDAFNNAIGAGALTGDKLSYYKDIFEKNPLNIVGIMLGSTGKVKEVQNAIQREHLGRVESYGLSPKEEQVYLKHQANKALQHTQNQMESARHLMGGSGRQYPGTVIGSAKKDY